MSDLRATIKENSVKLIGKLNQRNRDVVSRRFGLKTGAKETLESIGQSYGITRERVRQIEEASLKQIRGEIEKGITVKIAPFVSLAENILEQSGGVLGERQMFERYFGGSGKILNDPANAALTFVLALDGKIVRVPEDENYRTFWGLSEQHVQSFVGSSETLVKLFDKENKLLAAGAFADFSKKSGVSAKFCTPAGLDAIMSVSKQISKNIFGEIGLNIWPDVKPRGVRDKSLLVLKKEGKPKHFREITQLINSTFSGDRKANVQTVHNELIKDNRFVLVGRGLYALTEWGYKAGTVKDVLVDILRTARKPVKKEEIVAQVMSHRIVKENTVLLNLQDSRVFKKTTNGYMLNEA